MKGALGEDMARRPMGKRRAARAAARVIELLIQNYLDVGQPGEDCDSASRGWTPADEPALTAAFERLMDEMRRRSGL